MRTIGLVTSGGDAPGMNAAIRAVVRTAVPKGFNVLGFRRGYTGLLSNDVKQLSIRDVGSILHLGGTILKTERCPEFATDEGKGKAAEVLKTNGVEKLIVIGGDGSFKGALRLRYISGIQIAGIPATIDNDIAGTETTIGFDTAVNTAVQAIDKIRDTAMSHSRIFIIEVMGRKRGFLALNIGIAAGAECILVPEIKRQLNSVCETLIKSRKSGKEYSILVIAEGFGSSKEIGEYISSRMESEVRLTILGHLQRGGSPTARSRLLASLFGDYVVHKLIEGDQSGFVGIQKGDLTFNNFETVNRKKPLDLEQLHLAEELGL